MSRLSLSGIKSRSRFRPKRVFSYKREGEYNIKGHRCHKSNEQAYGGHFKYIEILLNICREEIIPSLGKWQ